MGKTAEQLKKFTSNHYRQLCGNPFDRFLRNSEFIGHGVIRHEGSRMLVTQYAMPQGGNGVPYTQPLCNFRSITRYGNPGFSAQTLDGTLVYSNRGYKCRDQDGNLFEIRPFSPAPPGNKEPFWSSRTRLPITTSSFRGEVHFKESEVTVEPESVIARSRVKQRSSSQTKVMGMSAKEAYEEVLETWDEKFSPGMQKILKRSINADEQHWLLRQYQPEWLHLVARSLAPEQFNPQRRCNLGAGPAWANTNMMVLERVGYWYAMNQPDSHVSMNPRFKMLFGSNVTQNIDFKLKICFGDRFMDFTQHMDTLAEQYPVFPMASDSALLTAISCARLRGEKPHSTVEIPVRSLFASKRTANYNLTRQKRKSPEGRVTQTTHASSSLPVTKRHRYPPYSGRLFAPGALKQVNRKSVISESFRTGQQGSIAKP